MTMGANGVFKCLCPPKYGGPLCEGKTSLKQTPALSSTVMNIVALATTIHLEKQINNDFVSRMAK